MPYELMSHAQNPVVYRYSARHHPGGSKLWQEDQAGRATAVLITLNPKP